VASTDDLVLAATSVCIMDNLAEDDEAMARYIKPSPAKKIVRKESQPDSYSYEESR
jgi:hypothetical protein